MLQFWRVLYLLLFPLLQLGVRVAAFFSPKIRATLQGRQHLFERIEQALQHIPNDGSLRVWIHAASVGEFEQARPIIQKLRAASNVQVFVSFLSVSGYEARKNYPGADLVCYLPEDTERNAARFLELLRPSFLLLMRYDFWFNHLFTAREYGVELILANATLYRNSTYLKPIFKSFYEQVFSLFDKIFTVTEDDKKNFETAFGLKNVEVAGDTRYDQVLLRSQSTEKVQHLKPFFAGKKVLVAGSVWESDLALLIPAFKRLCAQLPHLSLILVPHEVDSETLEHVQQRLSSAALSFERLSSLSAAFSGDKVLVVDQIGYLAELYSLANVAYIGGGFGTNVHNVLEAAVYGIPLVYGSRIRKSREAQELAAMGAARVVRTEGELFSSLQALFTNETLAHTCGHLCRTHVYSRLGATEKIFRYLFPLSQVSA
ncbi:MAG: 3-deoxy-D-manno-octulosonic acid transferase [Candidatus Thermochlorobacter aerophilum]|jgi:3-deoxy-D-manno-octulosonic-acid transferase|uniref:3-deoxy-D-manno-octulosonic acid transferase n=1 Tax=Candidatus Thermochlorobacter aerophilus TaxID=1868324 RepID=A0A395LYV9_9BACT|nr:MAG: 3-deoxy-D-manno-octulosonic acid transferase [Candidatus Thermochlorobacter aerophilum]